MGAGSDSAGSGPAGFAVGVGSVARGATLPVAIKYDPTLRQFVTLDNGQLAAIHPVDQAVLFAVTIEKGTLRSSPETGIDLSRIRTASPETLQREVTDAVRTALVDLIADRSIQFLGAPLVDPADGRAIFYVDYINMKLPDAPTVRVISNA